MDGLRLAVLVCCCLLTFGSYFSYDLPGALPADFRVVLARTDPSNHGLFYSFYSLPNTVQPFFGGIIIDQVLGLRRGAIICASLIAAGCVVVSVAASVEGWEGTSTAFTVALAGRFVFGLGGETLSVCQNAFCAKWFKGADLATAFAIVLSFARVGSAVNFAIEPQIADSHGFSTALWLSSALCAMSVGAAGALSYLDFKFEYMTEDEQGAEADAEVGAGAGADAATSSADASSQESDLEQPLLNDRMNRSQARSSSFDQGATAHAGGGGGVGGVDEENSLLRARAAAADSNSGTTPASPAAAKVPGLSTLQVLRAIIGPREVLIYLICMLFYVGVFIFIAVASKMLVDTYESVDKISAGLLTSLPYTVSAVVSPLLGLTMDKIGRGGFFVSLSCASLCVIHLCFALIPQSVNPTAMMVWLGLTYSSCAASLWPMIAVVVESRNISTAYGLMMSVQNTGLALAPIFILSLQPDYRAIEMIFATLAAAAFACSIALYFVDSRSFGGALFAAPKTELAVPGESPYVNPLNPRATPFLRHSGVADATASARRAAIAPKTPQMLRRQYFRKLRIQSHI